MAIGIVQDKETKTALEVDVEELQRKCGLACSFAQDMAQQVRIAVRKHGIENVCSEIGCDVEDLQEAYLVLVGLVKKCMNIDIPEMTKE